MRQSEGLGHGEVSTAKMLRHTIMERIILRPQRDSLQDAKNRVAIFIDGSNLYHSLEENCGRADLNFEAFSYKLASGRPIFRTYYYNVLQDAERKGQGAQEQQKFLASLYSIPRLEVRLGTMKYRG